MARVVVIITVIFSLVVLSHSRTPFKQAESVVTQSKPSTSSPESDYSKSVILLPSEKPESESLPVERSPKSEPVNLSDEVPENKSDLVERVAGSAKSEPVSLSDKVPEKKSDFVERVAGSEAAKSVETATENKIVPAKSVAEFKSIPIEKLAENEAGSDTIEAIGITQPLTITYNVRFRPINRHFHRMQLKRPIRFRFPHCRHHGKPFIGQQLSVRQIPFGDDMIQSEKSEFPMHQRYEKRQIPARWMRFPGEMRQFPTSPVRLNGGWLKEEEFDSLSSSEEEEREEKGAIGFMKHFRKFLNRF